MHSGPVQSYNEWDPLQEVVVGTARGSVQSPFEPAMAAFHPLDGPGRSSAGGHHDAAAVDAAQRQLDNLADVLEREGVRVVRPDPVDNDVAVTTPTYAVPRLHGQSCPRDSLLVLGDTIIEVPMAMRARSFEYRAYRRLTRDYFRRGAKWISAPRPLLEDEAYESDYTTVDVPYAHGTHSPVRELEPLFDAACFARMGRDVFWQPDVVSNATGLEWLERHFSPEFRFHKVEFTERCPEHIDTTFVPIRPGLVVTCPERPAIPGELDLFERNDWQVVDGPASVRYGLPSASLEVSNWISLNFLSLDEKTVVAEAGEKPLHDFLRSHGCEVIPVEFDAVFAFGGSFHCCTLDVRRDGVLESYFPSLD